MKHERGMKELLGQNGTSGWGSRTEDKVLNRPVCLWALQHTDRWKKIE